MGKKSKRKAVKAKAAGNPGAALGLGPRPNGITCTNEDPSLCASCLASIGPGTLPNLCCGTKLCTNCDERANPFCAFCTKVVADPDFQLLKQRLQQRFPWAEHVFAMIGHKRLYPEAFKWYQKAANKNHPGAFKGLGRCYAEGLGCEQSLSNSRRCYEKAMELDLKIIDSAFACCLCELAKMMVRHDKRAITEATNMLLPLLDAETTDDQLIRLQVGGFSVTHLESVLSSNSDSGLSEAFSATALLGIEGVGRAQHFLGGYYDAVGDTKQSRPWLEDASKNLSDPISAALASFLLEKYALMRAAWVNTSPKFKQCVEENELLEKVPLKLASLRGHCATCNVALSTSNRKLCKGCKVHCYCSHQCQKMHWNRKDGLGHAEECKEAQDLAKQWREKDAPRP